MANGKRQVTNVMDGRQIRVERCIRIDAASHDHRQNSMRVSGYQVNSQNISIHKPILSILILSYHLYNYDVISQEAACHSPMRRPWSLS